MRYTLALLALAAAALANPRPQGVTEVISPSAVPPSSCAKTRSGDFQITVQNVTKSAAKRDLAERQDDGKLTITLTNGILKDQLGRTGYIAANYQFQFDKPPQTGAIFTSGWSVCSNGSLALGGSAIFYQCLSGSFFNLYDRHWAAQCNAIYIEAIGGSNVPVPSTPVPSTTPTTTSTRPPSTVSPTTNSTTVVATPATSKSAPTSAANATASSTGAAGGAASSSASASTSASGSSSGAGGAGASSGSPSGAASTTVVVTTSPSSAAAPTSGSSGSVTTGAPAGTTSAPAASTGGAVPGAVSAPQGLLALAAGVFGAVIMI